MRLIITILLLSSFTSQAYVVNTVFGAIDEKNPLAIELINSAALQRLKYIDQSGPIIYFNNTYPQFSRYDHSLGVYVLLKRYNVSEQEQIAGLMHDTSHTVFSHLGDYVMQNNNLRTESYQDNIHDWFLTKSGVLGIVNKYKFSLEDISPKNPKYTALEQPFPDMNADRIEYNLHTALIFNDLSTEDINQILNALQYKDGKWFFNDVTQAKKFAKLSTYYTRNMWGSPSNNALYIVMGTALKRAVQLGVVDLSDIHFGIDQEVVNKLKSSKDPILKSLIEISANINKYYTVTSQNDSHVYNPIKMRGIDPLVMQDGKLIRLSAISIDFKQELDATAQYAKQGTHIKFINIDNPDTLQALQYTLS